MSTAASVAPWAEIIPGLLTPVVTLHIGDALDGEDAAPGFSYPVANAFAVPLAYVARG